MSAAYYDRIARKWDAVTGFRGGALKQMQLNIEAAPRAADGPNQPADGDGEDNREDRPC